MGSESLLFGFQFLIFWRGWTDNLTRNDSAKISFENLWIRAGEMVMVMVFGGRNGKILWFFLNLMMRCRCFC
jgi:hypothetical protein